MEAIKIWSRKGEKVHIYLGWYFEASVLSNDFIFKLHSMGKM